MKKLKTYSIDFGILFIANSFVYNDVFQMLEPLKYKMFKYWRMLIMTGENVINYQLVNCSIH